MELSYATKQLRARCLNRPDAGRFVGEEQALLAVIADLRAAPTLDDAPLQVIARSLDEAVVLVRGTDLRVVVTVAHNRGRMPVSQPVTRSARLQLLAIDRGSTS